jgi:quercetin dioxygenase-like cupin family protein
MPITVSRTDEPWRKAPTTTGANASLTEGIQRRMRAKGEEGMFIQDVFYRPGKVVDLHSHTRAQVFYIVEGSGTFDDGTEIRVDDAIQVPANLVYGFTAGDEGLRLLIIRTGEARMRLANKDAAASGAATS